MTTSILRRGESADRRAVSVGRALALAAMLALVCLGAGGCGVVRVSVGAPFDVPVAPPQGFLFSNTRAPMTVDFDNNPVGQAAPRSGSASSFYLYEPFFTRISVAWEDISVADVARRAGIESVSYADYETFSILGVFGKFTLHVHGR